MKEGYQTKGKFYRTCQECENIQEAKEPKPGEITNSYANSKCKKCKSESLDYGSIFNNRGWDDE